MVCNGECTQGGDAERVLLGVLKLRMAEEISMSGQAKKGGVLRDQRSVARGNGPLWWVGVCGSTNKAPFLLGTYNFNYSKFLIKALYLGGKRHTSFE